jgi:hypothetical protein
MNKPFVKNKLNPVIHNMLRNQLKDFAKFVNSDKLITCRRERYLLDIGYAKLNVPCDIDEELLLIGIAIHMGYIPNERC